jgi:hypothetical protein
MKTALATARDNVAIHIGNTDIYADYAQYNTTTHDVELKRPRANLSDTSLYIARVAFTILRLKRSGDNGRTESEPYFLTGAM